MTQVSPLILLLVFSLIGKLTNAVRKEVELFNERGYQICSADIPVYIKNYDYVIDEAPSTFQNLTIMEEANINDKCLDLDDIVQICASYRPHYHEPFVHFPASYLKDIKRVAFIGGGDSMLLHEILKYDSIELVLGLELDSLVVRRSFQHFFTQPHWDDERVEWIFGDAAKSIMLLPREYFGTFDMVLVDVSETVMSFSVSKEMNILESLSSLMKPDGILVKNEQYFEPLSKIFKHTAQVYLPHTPMICKQDYSMGSNEISFLQPNFIEIQKNQIDTKLTRYKPLTRPSDHFHLISRYSRNRLENTCDATESQIRGDNHNAEEDKSVGILMILEAEKTSGMPIDISLIETALKSIDLVPLTSVSVKTNDGGNVSILVTNKGIITSHCWSSHKYCAFDVHLWGDFLKMENIKSILLATVQSSYHSSYKFIMDGIYGASSFSDKDQLVGPVMQTQQLAMDDPFEIANRQELTFSDSTSLKDIALRESLSTLMKSITNAIFFCGNQSRSCNRSLDIFKELTKQVVVVRTCDQSNEYEKGKSIPGILNISLCDTDIDAIAAEVVEKVGKVDVIAFDNGLASNQFEKLTLALSQDSLSSLLTSNGLVVDLGYRESANKRVDLMEKFFHHSILRKPKWRAGFYLGETSELGIGSFGNENFITQLMEVTTRIRERFGADVFVQSVKGRNITTLDEDFDPDYFHMHSYDNFPGASQMAEQRQIGTQGIYQLELDDDYNMNGNFLSSIEYEVKRTLQGMEYSNIIIENTEVAHGYVLVAIFTEGHLYLTWDGKNRMDVNIFTLTEKIDYENTFFDMLLEDKINMLKIIFGEDQPRGFGRTVLFTSDVQNGITGDCFDIYDTCPDFQEFGECSASEEHIQEFMMKNCKRTCGLC
jgi:spermidine synthase/S-adenosylmethionine/arginine decarboxylase-like enzyme